MNIGVIGAGYVGLVTAVCFADIGHNVKVVEKDLLKLSKLQDGRSTIFEPGLTEMLKDNLIKGRVQFFESPLEVINSSDILFLCVGTPPKEDGSADLTQIESAILQIVEESSKINHPILVVVKSTVPVGTSEWLEEIINSKSSGAHSNIEIASNPEFLREGAAVKDFMFPDRIVVGTNKKWGRALLEELYRSFDCPKVFTDCKTAEIIKYASNSFLATKISFINMVADLCDSVSADITKVAEGMGYDKRIGSEFLRAGIGFGGSCFPKDIKAFNHVGLQHDVNFGLLEEVMKINNDRPSTMVKKLKSRFDNTNGKTVGILGLTFKPDTDDVRESQAAKFIELLLSENVRVQAYDPIGVPNFISLHGNICKNIQFVDSEVDVFEEAHAVVLLTEWKQFKDLDWKLMKDKMQTPIVLDTRNYLINLNLDQSGFDYITVGSTSNKLEVKITV